MRDEPTTKENMIRGAFSFLAAAVTLYMSAEYMDSFLRLRRAEALVISLVTGGLSIMEAMKVGQRVEAVLGLRSINQSWQ